MPGSRLRQVTEQAAEKKLQRKLPQSPHAKMDLLVSRGGWHLSGLTAGPSFVWEDGTVWNRQTLTTGIGRKSLIIQRPQ